jgi:hypothetical protein
MKPRSVWYCRLRHGWAGGIAGTRHACCRTPTNRPLALWVAACAEHVLHFFESVQPLDPRPGEAIEQIRAWASSEIRMPQSRAAGGDAMAAARDDKRQSFLEVGVGVGIDDSDRLYVNVRDSYLQASNESVLEGRRDHLAHCGA